MKQFLLASAAVTLWLSSYAQVTQVFNYTGGVQTFTVPPCVTSVNIMAKGAQGGAVTVQSPLPQGGLGATMQGDFAVNPGDVLTIIVGGQGMPDPSSSGGGGGSGVNNGATVLIVAGGGGGVDFQDPNYAGMNAVTTQNGVDGNSNPGSGGVSGGSGMDYMYTSTNISRGGNGWNAGNNGSTGTSGTSTNTTFTTGTWGLGGGGGSVGYGYCNCGGGGGGYSGGGSANINQSGGGGGSYNIGTNQVNTAGDNSGDGTVIITYTPGAGVPASPSSISGTTAVCAGSSGPLSFTIPAVATATGYTWSVTGDASIVSGQGTTAVDVQPGTMTTTISVTADNACGSSAPTTFVLTIQQPPTIALGNDVTQCGGTVTLDAQNAGSTYFWSDASTNQTLVVSASGTYWVNVTNANGCGAYDTINVTINALPVVSLGGSQTQCGGTITLDAQNAGSTYLWSDNSTAQTLVVNSTGTYSVTVTDANGCSATDMANITINPVPAPVGTAPSAICIDDQVFALSGAPSGGVWSGPGVTGSTFDPVAAGAGTHQLIYTYTDTMTSCTGMDTVSVFVDLCLGMNDAGTISFSVSPNPNNGSFVIDFGAARSNVMIELIDITGRTVQSNTASGARATVNCESQPSGVYFVRVTADGVSSMQKITISK